MLGPGYIIRPRVRTPYSVVGIPNPSGLSRKYNEAINAAEEELARTARKLGKPQADSTSAASSGAPVLMPKETTHDPSEANRPHDGEIHSVAKKDLAAEEGVVVKDAGAVQDQRTGPSHPSLSPGELQDDQRKKAEFVDPTHVEMNKDSRPLPKEGMKIVDSGNGKTIDEGTKPIVSNFELEEDDLARLCSRVEWFRDWLSKDPLLMCAEQVRSERRLRGHENDEKFHMLCSMILGVSTIPLLPSSQRPESGKGTAAAPASEDSGRSGPVRPVVIPIGSTYEEVGSLRSVAAGGVPTRCRPTVWRLLSEYIPPSTQAAPAVLRRKRKEYHEYVSLYFSFAGDAMRQGNAVSIEDSLAGHAETPLNARAGSTGASASARTPLRSGAAEANKREIRLGASGVICVAYPKQKGMESSYGNTTGSQLRAAPRSSIASQTNEMSYYLVDLDRVHSIASQETAILAQLSLDLPRHRLALFHIPATVAALTRCMFLWSLRHPAVGYVQGIDDIMAVFFLTFLGEAIRANEVMSMESTMKTLHDEVCAAEGNLAQSKDRITSVSPKSVDGIKAASETVRSWKSFLPSFSTDTTASSRGTAQATVEGRDAQEFLRRIWCYQPLPPHEYRAAAASHPATHSESPGNGADTLMLSRSQSKLSGNDPENSTSFISPMTSASATPTSKNGPPSLTFNPSGGTPGHQELRRPRIPRPSHISERGAFTIIGREVEDDLTSNDIEDFRRRIDRLPHDLLESVEADTYWCGGRFLSWVQDNYYHSQPGIMEMLSVLDSVLRAADPELMAYLDGEDLMVRDCCFQWMHCLLARELPQHLIMLLWDTYFSIGSNFSVFHVYVCAALIISLRNELLGRPLDILIEILKSPLNHRNTSGPVQAAHAAPRTLMGSAAATMSALMYGRNTKEAHSTSTTFPSKASQTHYRRKDKIWLDGIIETAFGMWRANSA